jgi:hypothetical protein
MVRTIEQILGIQPMNQEDYAAEPMYGAFTEKPNFSPYTAVLNEIPLTLGVEGFPSTAVAQTGGPVQGEVPVSMQSVYEAWMSWKRRQSFLGQDALPDSAKPVLLNRLDWYSAHDWKVAYPGDPKTYLPDEVPDSNLPVALLGD